MIVAPWFSVRIFRECFCLKQWMVQTELPLLNVVFSSFWARNSGATMSMQFQQYSKQQQVHNSERFTCYSCWIWARKIQNIRQKHLYLASYIVVIVPWYAVKCYVFLGDKTQWEEEKYVSLEWTISTLLPPPLSRLRCYTVFPNYVSFNLIFDHIWFLSQFANGKWKMQKRKVFIHSTEMLL